MAFQRYNRPPGAADIDDALAEHWAPCPYWDCDVRFDPFEIVENGGIPDHDCGDLFGGNL